MTAPSQPAVFPENRPRWFSVSSTIGSVELAEMCSRLGFSTPIWHRTDSFIDRIESSVDEAALERERSWIRGEGNRGDGMISLTNPAAFNQVIEEATIFFEACTKRVGLTEEFDKAIRLLRDIHSACAENQPVQTSMTLDLIAQMWCGRNWERLPEPLNERRLALDDVLRDVGLARERPTIGAVHTKSHSLAKAAQAYLANDGMHSRWMAKLIAGDMLDELEHALKERQKRLSRWWRSPLAFLLIGAIVARYSISLAVSLWIAAVAIYVVEYRNSSALAEIERIANEIKSGCYSGGVLARRLERLNRSWCEVPSVLTETLQTDPYGSVSSAVWP